MDDNRLRGILDMLHYDDLLNLAMLSPHVRFLFAQFYVSKYRWNEHLIDIYTTQNRAYIYSDGIESRTNIAKNYDQVLFVLRYFGHTFTRLSISISSIKYVEEIQFLINTHCSAASQEMALSQPYFAFARNMNIRFENVTSVTINNASKADEPLQLDTAFPQMRKLTFNCHLNLNHHFPHLTEIMFEHNSYGLDLSEFVRLNPQLNSVQSAIFNNSMFLATINGLPNLQSLSFAILPKENYKNHNSFETVQFNNVKHFTVDLRHYNSDLDWNGLLGQLLEAMQFNDLNSFSVYLNNYYHPEAAEFLIGMVGKYTALQNVIFDAEISIDQMSQMIAPLQRLKDFTFTLWESAQTADKWDRFIEQDIASNPELEKLNVKLPSHSRVYSESISNFVPLGWSHTQTLAIQNAELVCFERNK